MSEWLVIALVPLGVLLGIALAGLWNRSKPSMSSGISVRYWDGDGSPDAPFSDRYAHGPLDDVRTALCYVRLQMAPMMQRAFSHLGTCLRCQWPWAVVRGHTTTYRRGEGCFPLCEDCWVELRTPKNRMPYYMQLVDSWEREARQHAARHPEYLNDLVGKRQLITEAVLNNEANDEVLNAFEVG